MSFFLSGEEGKRFYSIRCSNQYVAFRPEMTLPYAFFSDIPLNLGPRHRQHNPTVRNGRLSAINKMFRTLNILSGDVGNMFPFLFWAQRGIFHLCWRNCPGKATPASTRRRNSKAGAPDNTERKNEVSLT